ncbi:MAG: hypothetical protein NVS4B11_26660 [Ktedonobacteraceae bacterium]
MEEQYGDFEEQGEEQRQLPFSPLSMTKTQMLLTGVPLVATGVVEVTSHFNFGGLLLGGFITFAVARHSQDILHYLVPGSDVAGVAGATERVVDAISPMHEEDDDQAVFTKLKRLVGIDPPRRDPVPRNGMQQENADRRDVAPEQKQSQQPVFPHYSQDERLSLGYLAKVGRLARFDPHMDMLLGKGLIVAGVQGMGKSNIAALVLESASRCDMPAVMFDLKREYHTIVDVTPNAIRAGHMSLQGSIPGYFVLSVENADEFAQLVMTGKHQAIIDLPSYGEDLTAAAKVITVVVKSLMVWSKAQAEDDRLPCLTMLDEAQVFLPQDQSLSPLSRETLNSLQSAFWQMCNMGRSLGYTMCFFTQSIANLQKWAIKNCQRKVVGIHVEKNDLDRCVEEVDEAVATREQIKTMPEGIGVVIGFTPLQHVVKFDKRLSHHVSNTPSVARLRKPLVEQRVTSVRQAYVQPYTPSSVASPMPDLPEKGVVQPQQQVSDEEKARAAWQAGNRTVGTLEKATGLTRRQAYKYYQQFLGGH